MKIGIFGDSYAEPLKLNDSKSWIDMLSEVHDVENFALGGTNIWFSVKLLLEHAHRFDKVLWVVTLPGRISVQPAPGDMLPLTFKLITGINAIKYELEKAKNLKNSDNLDIKSSIKILNGLHYYYLYCIDYDYEWYVHKLIVDDITKKFPNIICLHADDELKNNSICLIYLKENTVFEKYRDQSRLGIVTFDLRNNHMIKENHEIFFQKVITWLNGQPVIIDPDDFVYPTNKDVEFYLRDINDK